jgi:predicted nucleotidyltransferase
MTEVTEDFGGLLERLAEARVEFIVIGGVAGILHGSARITYDLDIVYSRDRANVERLVRALDGLNPYLRGAPAGLPFRWNADTLTAGLNFTLTTTSGDIDILGEVAGGGRYQELLPDSSEIRISGITFRCVTLLKLIALKRAAGRPKDFDAIAELQVLLEEQDAGAE